LIKNASLLLENTDELLKPQNMSLLETGEKSLGKRKMITKQRPSSLIAKKIYNNRNHKACLVTSYEADS